MIRVLQVIVVHSNPMAGGTISVAIRAYTQARERDN
jgi:hypothetical protein